MPMVPSTSAPLVYVFPETAQTVRSLMVEGDPWWVARDIGDALELGNMRSSLALLDDDEKGVHAMDTPGGSQDMVTVNEPGLYSLILRSRKPQAKAFKRWITHEVIPQIRKNGRFEVAPPETPKELNSSLMGVQPPRAQAELLVILSPLLPALYVTATAKVIVARAMGERPELDPSETPLYAATFLAEKGHKPATVTKFQSGFGSRVSNAYLKLHGRRPEKIPGPAGSRIDKVVVYSEEDRPLLEQIYAGLADIIRLFESGGQEELSA